MNMLLECLLSDYGVDVESHISNTRVVVTLKGSVDVIVSPMMLEALHR